MLNGALNGGAHAGIDYAGDACKEDGRRSPTRLTGTIALLNLELNPVVIPAGP